MNSILTTRAVDDGQPFVLLDAPDGVAGCAVSAHVCGNPTCPCTELRLLIHRLILLEDGGLRVEESIARGTVSSGGDAARLEAVEGPAAASPEMLAWILEKLSTNDCQDWLRERWARGRGQAGDLEFATAAVRSGFEEALVPFYEVIPWHYDLTVIHEGRKYLVEDMYCLNAGCRCDDVAVDFIDLGIDAQGVGGVDGVAHAQASLGSLKSPDLEGGAIAKALWAALLQQVGVEKLRRRYTAARATVAKPAPQAATLRTGRNAPCPCGSGKKFKRCCG